MNILETPIGRYAPGIVNVIVEIPKGGKKKYRYHRKKRTFVVDYRLMIPAPTEYGWVPQTLSPVGKRLDAMVLVRKPTWAGNICEARPIGALKRRDQDHKIIAVLLGEPRFESVRDLSDLDGAIFRRIAQFFEPFFPVEGWMNRQEATAFLEKAHRVYLEKAHLRQIPESFEARDEDEEDFPEEFEAEDSEHLSEEEEEAENPRASLEEPGESALSRISTEHEVP